MRWFVVALVPLAACNLVFGVDGDSAPPDVDDARGDGAAIDAFETADLDNDMVDDSDDPCIAPPAEDVNDDDNDSSINKTDTCPLDLAIGVDTDIDLIDGICDPDDTTAGVRTCLMTFTKPDLNTALWHATDATGAWRTNQVHALEHAPADTAPHSLFAARPISVGGAATVDAAFQIDLVRPSGHVILWLDARANVGCELEDQGSTYYLRSVTGEARQVTISDGKLRIRGTWQPAAPSSEVTCELKNDDEQMWVAAPPTMASAAAPGYIGFTATLWALRVTALEVFRHP